nr:unnamed protein product [Callosobruchus analis]CAI5864578.1 unnamed protein product [Callosobruchus analis]
MLNWRTWNASSDVRSTYLWPIGVMWQTRLISVKRK